MRAPWFPALLVVLTLAACTPAPRLVDTPVTSPVPEKVDTGELVVGVSSVAGGYNPHHLSDQSVVTTALANLVLPSVFRPGADGTPRLDDTLMSSASVTDYDPYTVTYRIRSDASWSDTAPIAAEDFVYLWQEIIDSTGAIDAAGYRLISDITARDAGKVVEVVFTDPYPGWRSLFTSLLPAHLLKDAPGGWDGALQTNFPATAGPYAVKALDTDRGEVVLERNDRYWEEPPKLDRIVLRRADNSGIVDALEAGHDQLALARLDAVSAGEIARIAPPVPVQTAARPSVLTLAVRPDRPQLTERTVRAAVIAALDRDQLVTVGTAGGPGVELRSDAQVLAPALPGYRATQPASRRHSPADVVTLLGRSGYTRTATGWTREGQPLDLVVGAPAERETAQLVAREVARQLAAVGIAARVVTPPADELYAQLSGAQTDGEEPVDGDTVDLAVISRPVNGDQATVLASNFGCAPAQDGQGPSPANVFGLCDPGVQPTMDAALTGALSVTDALAAIEPLLWDTAVALPLYQESETLAVRPEVSGVAVGPPLVGPFAGAASWQRAAG
ncbi:ABC transporter family substrate-binding protein [Actinophytocola xinjiangensis]|uniref:ABC transporter family substrate-binding protein n=1 Tax=Actinophytocola xinjiangensis TaxID=485602 RepID=UPI000A9D378D|nr:ABC transporter family substrate-binding protein [Actinophytocola xinjiangensis]